MLPMAPFDCSKRATAVVPNLFGCGIPADLSLRDAPFIFVHVPKASGTSAEIMLRTWRNTTRNPKTLLRLLRPPAPGATLSGRSLYIGKRSGLAEHAVPGPKLMATVLREPAERMLSHYTYLRARSRARLLSTPGLCTVTGPHANLSFSEWYVRHHAHLPDINEFEVRLLVTEPAQVDIVRTAEASTQGLDGCTWAQLPTVTDEHVRLARDRLCGMSLIGLTSEFDRSMRLWAARLPGFEYRSLRICGNERFRACGRSNRAQIPGDVLQRIRKENPGSYALWNEARALFAAQSKVADDALAAEATRILGARKRKRTRRRDSDGVT